MVALDKGIAVFSWNCAHTSPKTVHLFVRLVGRPRRLEVCFGHYLTLNWITVKKIKTPAYVVLDSWWIPEIEFLTLDWIICSIRVITVMHVHNAPRAMLCSQPIFVTGTILTRTLFFSWRCKSRSLPLYSNVRLSPLGVMELLNSSHRRYGTFKLYRAVIKKRKVLILIQC